MCISRILFEIRVLCLFFKFKRNYFLFKFHAEKEDSYQKLLSHREKVKEDKFLLEKHEVEHQRLISLIEKNKPVEWDTA